MAFADKDTLAKYVLGELSLEDSQRLEKKYLADDGMWETLSAVENDLIDSYVRGGLPEQQRRQFERHFLDSPEKYDRVEMAKLLMDTDIRQSIKVVPPKERRQHGSLLERLVEFASGRHHAMAFAVGTVAMLGLAVVAVIAFLILQNRHLQAEIARLQSQQTALQALQHQTEKLEQNAGNNAGTQDQREAETISALLLPGLSRQPGPQNTSGVLRVPATASWIQLMLELERDPYSQYQVVIETPEGSRVNRAGGLASQPDKGGGRIVSVRLPSQALKKGDYVITLSGQNAHGGQEIVGSYSLSVLR